MMRHEAEQVLFLIIEVDRLLEFARSEYQPEENFRSWVRSCEWRLLNCIETAEGIGFVNDYKLIYE